MVLYNEMRSSQLAEAADQQAIVVLAVGAIEQHGPCLPVEVDIRICYEVAVRAARRVHPQVPVLVMPPLHFGVSSHQMGFPGSITLRSQTLISLVADICDSLVTHGFRRIMLLNGHGGNLDSLKVAARELRDRAKVRCVVGRYWDFGREQIMKRRETPLGGMAHAGELEHSCMLALTPHLVDDGKRQASVPTWKTSYINQDLFDLGKVNFPYDVHEVSRIGVVGDPTTASAEKGEQFMGFIVDGLAAFFDDFYRWDLDEIVAWPS